MNRKKGKDTCQKELKEEIKDHIRCVGAILKIFALLLDFLFFGNTRYCREDLKGRNRI